jgi:hypothetical protein
MRIPQKQKHDSSQIPNLLQNMKYYAVISSTQRSIELIKLHNFYFMLILLYYAMTAESRKNLRIKVHCWATACQRTVAAELTHVWMAIVSESLKVWIVHSHTTIR